MERFGKSSTWNNGLSLVNDQATKFYDCLIFLQPITGIQNLTTYLESTSLLCKNMHIWSKIWQLP